MVDGMYLMKKIFIFFEECLGVSKYKQLFTHIHKRKEIYMYMM